MELPKTCKYCTHSDTTREKDTLVRCVKKHVFVPLDGTCQFHSSNVELNDEELKALMQAFGIKR